MIKNRIFYAVLFLTSLTFIYFYGGKVPYMFFAVILAAPAISFLYTVLVYDRFKFTQSVDKYSVVKGETINFNVRINNEDFFLYPYINLGLSSSETIFSRQSTRKSLSILPGKTYTISFSLECKYRGYYPIGLSSIEIEDFLGIWKLNYPIHEKKYLTIYPKVVFLDRFKLKANFQSDSHTTLSKGHQDMTTISDIRQYSYGDSKKIIHWKLSAKLNELMVKNYQSTSQTNATLFLDLNTCRYPADTRTVIEDKLIESTVALIYYCLYNHIPVNLIYYKDELVNIELKTPSEFDEVYTVLAKLTFIEEDSENIDIKDILSVYLETEIKRTNLLIFTCNPGYELYSLIHRARLTGNGVSLLYVSPEELAGHKDSDTQNIMASLSEFDINVYNLNCNEDLKLVLER